MARQQINIGATDNDPSAESVNSAFTKCNSMFAELFTANSLSGRQVIDLAGADTIRVAFQKVDQNTLALYTALGLAGRTDINDGAFSDDPSAESIRSAFTDINGMTATLYAAPGAGVYVSTGGNDTGGDGSIGSPYRTIAKGRSVLTSGQTLWIRGGTYAEAISGGIPNGTASAYTRIAGYPGESVLIKPTATGGGNRVINLGNHTEQYIAFEGLILDGSNASNAGGSNSYVAQLVTLGHIRFLNCEIRGGASNGIYLSSTDGGFLECLDCVIHDNGLLVQSVPDAFGHGIYMQTTNNLVEGCDIYGNGAYGVQLYSGVSGAVIANNIIRKNRFHGNGVMGGGSLSVGGQNNRIYNNLSYENDGQGLIVQYNSASGNQILNNTCVGNSQYGIYINTSASNTIVRNNITYQNTGGGIQNAGTSTTLSNNLAPATNPLFANAGADDYHLQVGSPALNAGFNVGSAVPDDFDGVTRPQGAAYDIGAYEKP